MSYTLTKQEARRFMLLKQGFLGEYRFIGKQGILEYLDRTGCIQYDPVDVCGKNPELVLQARIKGFKKEMLYELLYEDRKLTEYFDKNLTIVKIEDLNYLKRIKYVYLNDTSNEEIAKVKEYILTKIEEQGCISSQDLEFDQKIAWHWMSTRLSRAALEDLYYQGKLVIHHRKGTIRYFALPSQVLPPEIINAKEEITNDFDFQKWRVLRRIKTVGLLWNKPSDAFLGIRNIKTEERKKIYQALLEEEKIFEINIEGDSDKFYISSEDIAVIEESKANKKYKQRVEFLAPLDGMMWDRKLIEKLFDFYYRWEIYTPEPKRLYGYYVLPILLNEAFIGRIEMACIRKESKLLVKNIWFEEGIKLKTSEIKLLNNRIEKFKEFHKMEKIEYTISFNDKVLEKN